MACQYCDEFEDIVEDELFKIGICFYKNNFNIAVNYESETDTAETHFEIKYCPNCGEEL